MNPTATTLEQAPTPRPASQSGSGGSPGHAAGHDGFQFLRTFTGPADEFFASLIRFQRTAIGGTAAWCFRVSDGEAETLHGASSLAPEACAAERWVAIERRLAKAAAQGAHAVLLGQTPDDDPTWMLVQPLAMVGGTGFVAAHVIPQTGGSLVELAKERLALTSVLAEHYAAKQEASAWAARSRKHDDLHGILSATSLAAAAVQLAHVLSERCGRAEVVVGWGTAPRMRLLAVSGMTDLPAKGKAGNAIRALFSQRIRTQAGPPDSSEAQTLISTTADGVGRHLAIYRSAQPENDSGAASDFVGCQSLIDQSAAHFSALAAKDRLWSGRSRTVFDRTTGWIRTPGSWGQKLGLALLVALLLWLALWPMPARVAGSFEVKSETTRIAAAPFAGTLGQVNVQPGDPVVAGKTVLASLRTDDLEVRLAGLDAEWLGFKRQAETARSENPTELRLAELESDRVEAERQLLRRQIERARVVAPIDGVVAEGDLKQLIGTPVAHGQTLFRVIDPTRLRADVRMAEDRIGRVVAGARVGLRPAADPAGVTQAEVRRVDPVAVPGLTPTVFRVRVDMLDDADHLVPGMRGRADIATSPSPLLWQWLRPTVEWLRMNL